jgi:hypothetical protein
LNAPAPELRRQLTPPCDLPRQGRMEGGIDKSGAKGTAARLSSGRVGGSLSQAAGGRTAQRPRR